MTFLPSPRSLWLSASLLVAPALQAQIPQDTFSGIIATLRSDDYDARHVARMELQDYVSEASLPDNEAQRSAVEAQLLAALEQDPIPTTQLWLLRQVASIGSDAAVDALSALLASENGHIADAARMALETNPSPRATDALIAGLQACQAPDRRVGFIDSLAQRSDPAAASVFRSLLQSDRVEELEAALKGLSRLPEARWQDEAEALRQGASSEEAITLELALARAGLDRSRLESLVREGRNPSIRSAAFAALAESSAGAARKLLRQSLSDPNADPAPAFIRIAGDSQHRGLQREPLRFLADVPPATQAVILGVIDEDAPKRYEKDVQTIARSDNESLAVQAYEALGRMGSVKSLDLLLAGLDARSRDIREAAAEAVAQAPDPRIDRKLLAAAQSGEAGRRLVAIEALSYRASPGAAELVNQLAADGGEVEEIREAAIDALERIGSADSLEILVSIAVEEPSLRRDAQRTLKRMTLRIADPERAWSAFQAALEELPQGSEAQLALLAVLDSAPTPEAVTYLKRQYESGGDKVQAAVIKTLPAWRNWDAGFALLDLAKGEPAGSPVKDQAFRGVGRLILGSDANFDFDEKFTLASAALSQAETPEQRAAIINGFRYSTWRERVHVTYNEVDPELKEAVLEFVGN